MIVVFQLCLSTFQSIADLEEAEEASLVVVRDQLRDRDPYEELVPTMEEDEPPDVAAVSVVLSAGTGVSGLEQDIRGGREEDAVSHHVVADQLRVVEGIAVGTFVHDLAVDEIEARCLHVDLVVVELEAFAHVRHSALIR